MATDSRAASGPSTGDPDRDERDRQRRRRRGARSGSPPRRRGTATARDRPASARDRRSMPCEPAAATSPTDRTSSPSRMRIVAAVPPPARKPTTIMPRPTSVASQPTTNSAGRRAALDGEGGGARPLPVDEGGLVGRGRRYERAGGSGRRRAVRAERAGSEPLPPSTASPGAASGLSIPSGPGSVGPSGELNARAADPALAPGSRGRPVAPGSGSGRTGRAAVGTAAGAVTVVGDAPPGAAIRPATSRACGSASMAAAGTSRRSKSLPHQAHSDQSIPTSRLQFGQTRFSRVRQDGQMIHSSSIRRSHDGQ